MVLDTGFVKFLFKIYSNEYCVDLVGLCVQIFAVSTQGKLLISPESYLSLLIYVEYIYCVHSVHRIE